MEKVIQMYILVAVLTISCICTFHNILDDGCQHTAVTHSQVTVAKTHEQTIYVIIQGYTERFYFSDKVCSCQLVH